MPDLILPTIIIGGLVVILSVPEYFWNIMKLISIVALSFGGVWLMGQLAVAAPVVVLSFLGGMGAGALLLGFSRKTSR